MDKCIFTIRKATMEDLPSIMPLYDYARNFMITTGNPFQWINGYPQPILIEQEIRAHHCYVCLDEMGDFVGTFCFIIGENPTYHLIENGHWLNNEPYGTIHRLASNGKIKGLADKCINWCFKQISNIRVDTHADNKVMQHILLKNGFTECGIIYTHNGTPRLAYQQVRH